MMSLAVLPGSRQRPNFPGRRTLGNLQGASLKFCFHPLPPIVATPSELSGLGGDHTLTARPPLPLTRTGLQAPWDTVRNPQPQAVRKPPGSDPHLSHDHLCLCLALGRFPWLHPVSPPQPPTNSAQQSCHSNRYKPKWNPSQCVGGWSQRLPWAFQSLHNLTCRLPCHLHLPEGP